MGEVGQILISGQLDKCESKIKKFLYEQNRLKKIGKSIRSRRRELYHSVNKVKRILIRYFVIGFYSNNTFACACCGENFSIMFLDIDHLFGKGREHRKSVANKGGLAFYKWLIKKGLPSGFRVLCSNCNVGRFRNGGQCPHLEMNLFG